MLNIWGLSVFLCVGIALLEVQGIETRINTWELNILCQLDYLGTNPPAKPEVPQVAAEKLSNLLKRFEKCTAGESHDCPAGTIKMQHESINVVKLPQSPSQALVHKKLQRLNKRMMQLRMQFNRHAASTEESYSSAVRHLLESVYGSNVAGGVKRDKVDAVQQGEMFKPSGEDGDMERFCGTGEAANGAGVTISNDMVCICAANSAEKNTGFSHACGVKETITMEDYQVGHAYDAWRAIVRLCDASKRNADVHSIRGALSSFSEALGALSKKDGERSKSPYIIGTISRLHGGCTGNITFPQSMCVDYRALADPKGQGTRDLGNIRWYSLMSRAADELDRAELSAVAATKVYNRMQSVAELAVDTYYAAVGSVDWPSPDEPEEKDEGETDERESGEDTEEATQEETGEGSDDEASGEDGDTTEPGGSVPRDSAKSSGMRLYIIIPIVLLSLLCVICFLTFLLKAGHLQFGCCSGLSGKA